jgi:hypothetical protein
MQADSLRTRKAELLDYAIPRTGPPCLDTGFLPPAQLARNPLSEPTR